MKIERSYHLFDAKNKVLGRLATEVARFLSGKNRVDYMPNMDQGAYIVVINSDQVRVTGNKEEGKIYYKHSGYPGSLRERTLKKQRELDSRKIITAAVSGMLPKNKLRAKRLKRLLVYKDDKQEHKIDVVH